MHRALLPFGRGRVCSRIIKSRGLRSNLSPQSAEKASFIYSGTGSGAAQGAQAVCTLLQVLCHNLLRMLKCLVLLGREHFQLRLEAGKRWSRQGCGGSWHGLTSLTNPVMVPSRQPVFRERQGPGGTNALTQLRTGSARATGMT